MSDPVYVDVTVLSARLQQFADERHWGQFHSPKNLVMALTGEVGELSAVFQWLGEDASRGAAQHPDTAEAVRHELADVMMYLVRLAEVLQVDLNQAVAEKLTLNAARYPVDKSHGSSKKYDRI
ncbi:MAG: nucleotide pyrophosphohydrolase [Alcaligenaceae bacterium]|nr:MAG: nucleotide pyrophosphohydrolase [Alcaligenaceae bacterium]